ncbi:MAG: C69 family dipeptidase [Bacteroidales bacterium]|nr:C69 family dipeptidase [Bacteroidales bacterium]
MKKILFVLLAALPWVAVSQGLPAEYEGQSCTSIMVGKRASTDGSVITSHTCDGRYRTWMYMEPAADHEAGAVHTVRRGTMHTAYRSDTTGVREVGTIPQVAHTYAYLNAAYPCLNEHQLAIGETTFSGPDTLVNKKGMFTIEELERVALMRCTTAREAIHLIGSLVKQYGYGDGGECITIADRSEVWQMEILGEGPAKVGGVWAAQRVPDDHVAVSANIPRIGKLQRDNPDYFLCSDNIEAVAKKYKLWDGKGDFIFWRAFNTAWAKGRNFREREYFIFNALAPSQGFTYDMDELPFSVKPDSLVDVRQVMALLRSTYEGTEMDMCCNVKQVVNRKRDDGSTYKDTVISPVANPWLTGNMQQTLNYIAPGTIDFVRTVSVAWCSYSFVAQLRDWLPDEVGGVCWVSVDNPGQSPRVPIFCGTTRLPKAYNLCGQKKYNEEAVLWQYRKANKLATVSWQRTRKHHMDEVMRLEDEAFGGMKKLEEQVKALKASKDELHDPAPKIANMLNDYTYRAYDNSTLAWRRLEEGYWQIFGMGF